MFKYCDCRENIGSLLGPSIKKIAEITLEIIPSIDANDTALKIFVNFENCILKSGDNTSSCHSHWTITLLKLNSQPFYIDNKGFIELKPEEFLNDLQRCNSCDLKVYSQNNLTANTSQCVMKPRLHGVKRGRKHTSME